MWCPYHIRLCSLTPPARKAIPVTPPAFVLSHFQIAPLLAAHRAGEAQTGISPDLGLSRVEVTLDASGVLFPNGERLTWDDAAEIADSEVNCFALEGGSIRKIVTFSETTQRHCGLMPTTGAPTLLLAGFPMHRIKGIDPHKDTLNKIRAAQPQGLVLDTTMGLGYTAIQAARSAAQVVTIELDPAVVEIASQNPWSRDLFDNPKIERRVGDSYDEIESFDNETFNRVIHDPPTFKLAGELYSGAFYRQLYRVLKRGGRLFHYIGDLETSSGHRVMRGVVERLGQAGFTRVSKRQDAFGVVAQK